MSELIRLLTNCSRLVPNLSIRCVPKHTKPSRYDVCRSTQSQVDTMCVETHKAKSIRCVPKHTKPSRYDVCRNTQTQVDTLGGCRSKFCCAAHLVRQVSPLLSSVVRSLACCSRLVFAALTCIPLACSFCRVQHCTQQFRFHEARVCVSQKILSFLTLCWLRDAAASRSVRTRLRRRCSDG